MLTDGSDGRSYAVATRLATSWSATTAPIRSAATNSPTMTRRAITNLRIALEPTGTGTAKLVLSATLAAGPGDCASPGDEPSAPRNPGTPGAPGPAQEPATLRRRGAAPRWWRHPAARCPRGAGHPRARRRQGMMTAPAR